MKVLNCSTLCYSVCWFQASCCLVFVWLGQHQWVSAKHEMPSTNPCWCSFGVVSACWCNYWITLCLLFQHFTVEQFSVWCQVWWALVWWSGICFCLWWSIGVLTVSFLALCSCQYGRHVRFTLLAVHVTPWCGAQGSQAGHSLLLLLLLNPALFNSEYIVVMSRNLLDTLCLTSYSLVLYFSASIYNLLLIVVCNFMRSM